MLNSLFFQVEKLPPLDIPRPTDVMDDFYIIASHELHASNTATTENHAKGLKGTLTYLIIVQDVINVQAGKFPGINKCAGCNKAVQAGIFQKSIGKNRVGWKKLQKLINVQDVIRPCRLEFFKIQ